MAFPGERVTTAHLVFLLDWIMASIGEISTLSFSRGQPISLYFVPHFSNVFFFFFPPTTGVRGGPAPGHSVEHRQRWHGELWGPKRPHKPSRFQREAEVRIEHSQIQPCNIDLCSTYTGESCRMIWNASGIQFFLLFHRTKIVKEKALPEIENYMFEDHDQIRRAATECMCNLVSCKEVRHV